MMKKIILMGSLYIIVVFVSSIVLEQLSIRMVDDYDLVSVQSVQQDNGEVSKYFEEYYHLLDNALSSDYPWWYQALYSFFLGLMCSFLPMVYPLCGVAVALIIHLSTRTLRAASSIAAFFTAGVLLIYSLCGLLSLHYGYAFGSWAVNPLFAIILSVCLLHIAGANFGWYPLFPKWSEDRLKVYAPYSFFDVSFLLGCVSGLITSTTITVPMQALLILLRKQPLLIYQIGYLGAFIFGNLLLVFVIATIASLFSYHIKGTLWSYLLRRAFGFFTIGLLIYLLHPVIPFQTRIILYLLLVCSLFLYGCVKGFQKLCRM
jgi:thiol:disulfide interchange protein